MYTYAATKCMDDKKLDIMVTVKVLLVNVVESNSKILHDIIK